MGRISRSLSIDIETYSDEDIREGGLYAYADSPSFEILIVCYAFGNEDIKTVDLAQGDTLPREFLEALYDNTCLKTAFNAAFEIYCFSVHLKRMGARPLQVRGEWFDTMILSAYYGYPLSLEHAAKVMNIEGALKDDKGKALIRYFSKPCKPTKTNGGRTRNYPKDAPEKWSLYLAYCKQDVFVERELRNFLAHSFGIPWGVMDEWIIDLKINTRGAKINRQYVVNILNYYARFKNRLLQEQKELTQLANPNSPSQLMEWLAIQGTPMPNLQKATVAETLRAIPKDRPEAQALRNRQALSKSSISKYERMIHYIANNHEDRARGLFQFYGAHTGRWSGRGIQLQNLPRMHYSDEELSELVYLVSHNDLEFVETFVESIPDTISALVRTAIIASEGMTLVVSDLSSIEACVTAWVTGCAWRLEVFRTTGKIYEASAAEAFGVPVEEITKDNPLRQQGKVMELALGYGGGASAMAQMDFNNEVRPDLTPEAIAAYRKENALTTKGLTNDQVIDKMIEANYDRLKLIWRKASPEIPEMWRALEDAAVTTILTRKEVRLRKGIMFYMKQDSMFIDLPSGRALVFPDAYIRKQMVYPKEGQDFKPFEAMGFGFMSWVKGGWRREASYGGKLFENIIQAIARDILMNAIRLIEDTPNPFRVVGHVHDEILTEAPEGTTVDELNKILCTLPDWADDTLYLRAAGFTSPYYMKD